MQRALSIALSLAAIVLSAVLAFREAPLSGGSAVPAGAASDGGMVFDASATPALDLHDAEPPPPPAEAVPPVEVPEGGFHLADGTPVAPLGKGAPRHIRFGVVLVSYEGAEGAPDKGARHRSDALSLATHLADEARQDFRGTVQRGDNGSAEDVGEVDRGVLEPGSEAVLFALPVGGVSGVIDTPRGFWIVKRLE
jgi:PPIC-type PPIASE domain